ncbi:glycosyltransferase involved in cell wall biosynthesis [Haloferula luteola]|uniref:Glycosyltransferase involved in cell wall biosynthesis n=1 Tax=Haloferula luteola TaxID=595692 RepID=A0A840V5R1_9BACT|nr:glycosyltransferase family 4 protein [Haloferula luteola]MBB5353302.1 glycosyltransferase involved in cell wall biosynthesis [Haloferula luteola]
MSDFPSPPFCPRIALLTWEFPPKVTGGLGTACAGIARALDRQTSVQVILPKEEVPDPYQCTSEDLADDAYARQVLMEAATADLIHAHDWMTFPAAMAWSRKSGRPWMAHLHSLEWDRSGACAVPEIEAVEAAGLRSAHAVITVSHRTAERATERYDLDPEKVHVVHNGIEPVDPWRRRTRRPRVLFVGRLTWQKAPDDFVKIAAEIAAREPRACFSLVGKGEMEGELRREIARLGMSDAIDMPGFLRPDALQRLLAESQVLCLPSREEPFGLVALEAALFGVPSVISTHAGVGEVLPSARWVEAGDIDGFAGRIWGLLADGPWREELGERARLQARWATWDRTAEGILSVARRVLESNGG